MKKLIIFLYALALSFSVPAQVQQKSETKDSNTNDRIFADPEWRAQFPGGEKACMKWLQDHIVYPEDCLKQMVEGRVQVDFVIERDGSISEVKARRSPHPSLSKEAVRVVSMMPKWRPKKEGNKTIRTNFNLPVDFTLPKDTQKALPKVYDEDINPMTQIDQAIVKAKSEGKFVICQVGGNWCPWCLRFADFITNDTAISKVIDENFVYIHVNYNPKKNDGAEKAKLTKQMMARLNNPARFGFPVFVVLDNKGEVLHIQDSSFLEEGKGYNQEKVLRFFKNWIPTAVGK